MKTRASHRLNIDANAPLWNAQVLQYNAGLEHNAVRTVIVATNLVDEGI